MKPSDEKYGDVVARLKEIVEALEGGELSLEDSLEKFASGVQLVKKGEKLLSDAERRIEQLLSEEGRTAPLNVEATTAPNASPSTKPPPAKQRTGVDEEDIPF